MSKPIQILLVNGPLPPPYGGVASYLSHALPFLASRGFVVHTIMDRTQARPTQYQEFERSGIHIHYGGGSKARKLFRILKHLPIWISLARTAQLPFMDLLRTIASQSGWIDAVEDVVRSHDIDVLHAYDYPWVQGFVALTMARRYGKKSMQTTFGEVVPHKEELIQHDAMGRRYHHFVSSILREFDCVVTLSKHCANELSQVGLPPEHIRVAYYGVDIAKFTPTNDGQRARDHLQLGDRPMVLFLGHIRPRKGPQFLVEAVPAIAKAVPEAVVVFVGPDFGILSQLKHRVRELGVEHNVRFVPPLPDELVVSLYAACDVFSFPTCTAIECFGLSMVQAMATAKPVVGSRIDGIPEVIIDGETGYLVSPSNGAEIAARVIMLLQDEALRKRMGEAGRRRVEERFDQNKQVLELENVYREVVGR